MTPVEYREEVVELVAKGAQLTAILARPRHCARIGVLLLVGGPQYRVGSHRLFVLLARSWAILSSASCT